VLPINAGPALMDNNTNALHLAKNLEGMEPGEMLPLALRNRGENNMCGAD